MDGETPSLSWIRPITKLVSVLHLTMALNSVLVVPLLAWLNYGRASWATAWIPSVWMVVVLPAAYAAHWHFWYVFAVPACGGSLLLWKRLGGRNERILLLLNAGAALAYAFVRVALLFLNIRPDIV